MPVLLPCNVLSPQDILRKGFHFLNGLPNNFTGEWTQQRTDHFKSCYGSSPVVLANQWYDLNTVDFDLGFTEADRTDKGLKMFFVAHHFLWAYPKNLKLLAAAFGMSKSMVEGEKLWRWIRMIAGLKRIKIVWPEEQYNNPRGQIFIISVDGTDFRVWEKKHPLFPYDKGQYSHKYNHGGLKYEIAIDIFTGRVV
jgi:hypothetical protein